MLRLIAVASCVLVVFSYPLVDETLNGDWELYKRSYDKLYSTEKEETSRRVIWEDNIEYIARHNREYDMGLHTYTLGLNRFADMADEEFVSMMNGYKSEKWNATGPTYSAPKNLALPTSIDYRDFGYVTKVKDQGNCGSCWTFSATGALEGQNAKHNGKLISLSEQNLIDCSKGHNDGCNGGIVQIAFDDIRKSGGIDTEQSYPYEETDTLQCRYKPANRGATCTGYVNIKRGNEYDLQLAIANVGPVSVAINSGRRGFKFYNGGIYNDKYCYSSGIDHAVLAVGFGTSNGEEYYIVKNSWGSGWGEGGYIRMSRNNRNQCGIATQACYPTV